MLTNRQLTEEVSETINHLMFLMKECTSRQINLPQSILLIIEPSEKTDFVVNGDTNFLRRVIFGLVNYIFQNFPTIARHVINDLEELLAEDDFDSMITPPDKLSIN